MRSRRLTREQSTLSVTPHPTADTNQLPQDCKKLIIPSDSTSKLYSKESRKHSELTKKRLCASINMTGKMILPVHSIRTPHLFLTPKLDNPMRFSSNGLRCHLTTIALCFAILMSTTQAHGNQAWPSHDNVHGNVQSTSKITKETFEPAQMDSHFGRWRSKR